MPSDEGTGVAILTELLGRYPVMVNDVLADEETTEIEPAELISPQIVNLDEWFVPVVMAEEPTSKPESPVATIARHIEETEFSLTLPAFYFGRSPDVAGDVEEIQLALDFG